MAKPFDVASRYKANKTSKRNSNSSPAPSSRQTRPQCEGKILSGLSRGARCSNAVTRDGGLRCAHHMFSERWTGDGGGGGGGGDRGGAAATTMAACASSSPSSSSSPPGERLVINRYVLLAPDPDASQPRTESTRDTGERGTQTDEVVTHTGTGGVEETIALQISSIRAIASIEPVDPLTKTNGTQTDEVEAVALRLSSIQTVDSIEPVDSPTAALPDTETVGTQTDEGGISALQISSIQTIGSIKPVSPLPAALPTTKTDATQTDEVAIPALPTPDPFTAALARYEERYAESRMWRASVRDYVAADGKDGDAADREKDRKKKTTTGKKRREEDEDEGEGEDGQGSNAFDALIAKIKRQE